MSLPPLVAPACVCGHGAFDHASDPSGCAGSPCGWAETYDAWGFPALNPCPCGDYNPTH